MVVDYLSKGWVVKKLDETTQGIPQIVCCFERLNQLNRKSLDKIVNISIQNLKNKFPDLRIAAKSKFLLFGKSVEIKGVPLEAVKSGSFCVRLTTKRIYVEVHGLDSATVLNCLV